MTDFKYKFLYLLITVAFLFLSKAKSQNIIYTNENVTKLESNTTEPINNDVLPYLSNIINNDNFNSTQANIIKAVIGFDHFIFDIARNITNGMKFAQLLILNKTKTFILPFIMFQDEKNFKNSILNNTELDSSKLGNLLPVNINLISYNRSDFTNSTLENTFFKPELFIPNLRGSHKMIKYNETTDEIAKNFTDISPRNESEKIINSTMVRLNKFLIPTNNDQAGSENKTSANRFLQFTLSFGLGELGNQYTDPNLINGIEIPDVGNLPFFIPDYNPWEPSSDDFYGFEFEYE